MGTTQFDLYVSYSQIAVYDPDEPLNMWTETHYKQGFSWRTGSVSFRTLSEAGRAEVRVSVQSTTSLPSGTVRAIVVPCHVGPDGIEIGSVTEAVPIRIPTGSYRLLFAAVREEAREVYEFQFVKDLAPSPSILVKDTELAPPGTLLMDAEPAV